MLLNQSKRNLNVALLIIFSMCCIPAVSAPYFNKSHEFTQPDGSQVTLIMNGDEFYMRAETTDGYTVVRDLNTGWICYAELSEDGTELLSTGVPISTEAGQFTQSAAGNEKHLANGKKIKQKLRINDAAKLKKIKQRKKLLLGGKQEADNVSAYFSTDSQTPQTITAGTLSIQSDSPIQAASTALPPTKDINFFTGTIKGLVLIFDFSDAPAPYTMQQYRDKINKANSYSGGNAASLRTYYEDVSRSVLIMDSFVYGIYRAPQTFAYYDSLGYSDGAKQLLSYGLNDLESNGFDFSQLSTTSAGEIRSLAVMYTGNPQTWAEGMWYHQGWWYGFSADGVWTGRYCTDDAETLDPGTLIHENGHMVAEWPDAYSYVGGEPGTWGIMGGGYCELPNPYFLYENGWLDGQNIIGTTGLKTMDSTDAHFAYFYYDPDHSTEFYMIRPYVNSLLYCPSIPDQGLTFWRVNTEGDNAQYPNTDRYVEFVHANGNETNKSSDVCFKQGGLLDHFAWYTTPTSDWKFRIQSGEPSGLEATNISTATATMTFNLDTPSVGEEIPIVDSTAGSEEAGNPKANSYDDNGDTRWCNTNSLSTAWIQYDLGRVRDIDRLLLRFYKSDIRTYPIKIEIDGTEVFNGSTSITSGAWEPAIPSTYGRYITITMTGINSSGNYWFSIYETKVGGTPLPELGIVSSTAGSEETGNWKANSYDGNDGSTRWCNNGTLSTAWIDYDLGDSYPIEKIALAFNQGDTRTYPVRIEIDGTEVFSGNTTMSGGYWEPTFTPAIGQHITITMTASNSDGNNWFSIWEARVWGSANEAPSFNAASFDEVDAMELTSYAGTLIDDASDPEGGVLTFRKDSGPVWLVVEPGGTLSGIPGDQDVGENTFTVRVTDEGGLSDTATMTIQVANIYSGVLGMVDLAGLAAEWLTLDCGTCNGADLDGDHDVTFSDFSIQAYNWLADESLQLHLKFDETSGTIASDSSIYHRSGQFVGSPVWSSGHVGGALSFDGVDDYVEVPGYKGITGGASRTCTAWIKAPDSSDEILSWGDLEYGGKWIIRINETGTLRAEVQGGYIYGSTVINDDAWHHIAVVLDSDGTPDISEVLLYVDGQLETPAAVSARSIDTSATQDVAIGVHYSSSRYFLGLIDDICIYDRALSEVDIQAFSTP